VQPIGIYLNDHRAAGAAGIALAKRCRRNNAGTPLALELDRVIEEIEQDAETLARVARKLGVRPNPVKVAAAQLGERAARLKLNGQLRGYSPLSRLVELEALITGIDARRSLLTSLHVAARPDLQNYDFAALANRAVEQRDRLIPFHRDAAAEALAHHAERRSPSVPK
jgi:transposase-like protein